MAERKMSEKGFIKKITSAKSAIGFIEQYRAYMTTGELAPLLVPLLAKVDSQELLPSPALHEIGNAVVQHIIMKEAAKIDKSQPREKHSSKNWVATIFNAKCIIQTFVNAKGDEEELIKGFELSQEASRWADLRLFDGAPDWFAVLEHSHSQTREIILRADSIARILSKKTSPVLAQRSQTTSSLSFGAHVKQTRTSFSQG